MYRLSCYSLLFVLPILVGFTHADLRDGRCVTTFEGTSTLHDFSGSATSQVFQVEWTAASPDRSAHMDAVIVYEVLSLSTQHKKRDRKMLKQFDPEHYPTLTGTFRDVSLDRELVSEIVPRFILTVKGRKQEIPFSILEWSEDEQHIGFTAEFELSLEKTGVRPPAVLGMIRVGDTLKLRTVVTVTKPPVSSPEAR